MATQSTDRYVFQGDTGAARAFGTRTAARDLAFLLPHLAPGISVVDCGCGTGSLTIDVAELVAPGEVVGIDISGEVVEQARVLAAERGASNVRFQVGNVYEPPVLDASCDVVVFCGVLAHLSEPATALDEAFRMLKPGGIIGAREPQKGGDWFGGPFREAVEKCNELIISDWRAGGGDPMVGRRLRRLLSDAGFVGVRGLAEYSPMLSGSPRVPGGFIMRSLARTDFRDRAVKRGMVTSERLERLGEEVRLWMASPDSVAALAECWAVGSRPES